MKIYSVFHVQLGYNTDEKLRKETTKAPILTSSEIKHNIQEHRTQIPKKSIKNGKIRFIVFDQSTSFISTSNKSTENPPPITSDLTVVSDQSKVEADSSEPTIKIGRS